MRSQSFFPSILRLLAGALVLAGLSVLGTACDTLEADNTTVEATTASSDEATTLDALITATTSSLDLSGPQSEQMGDIARRFRGDEPDPGALWTAAAEMHPTLTDEQIDSLEARLRTAAEGFANGPDHQPPNGPDFGNGPPNGGIDPPMGVGPNGPGEGPGGPLAGLDLTDEQKEALRSIRDTYHQDYLDLIAQYEEEDISESEAAHAYVELAAAMREEARDVLTEEQRAQIEERCADRGERLEAMRAARIEALNLSEMQADGFDAMVRLEMGPQRPGGFVGNFDAWLTAREALLTGVQTEITIVHASLVAEHMRRMMQRRRGQGPDGGGPGGFGG